MRYLLLALSGVLITFGLVTLAVLLSDAMDGAAVAGPALAD